MNKKKLYAIIAASVLVMTAGGGYALGVSAPFTLDSTKPFYACVTGVNGNITKVSNTPKTCPKGSVAINFNNSGPAGPKGEKGDPGLDAQNLLGSYIESPDGSQRLQLINVGAEEYVKVGDSILAWDKNARRLHAEMSQYYSYYESSNCTGDPKILRIYSTSNYRNFQNTLEEDQSIAVTTALELETEDGILLGKTSKNRNLGAGEFHSYYNPWSGCLPAFSQSDFEAWKTSRESWTALSHSQDQPAYPVRNSGSQCVLYRQNEGGDWDWNNPIPVPHCTELAADTFNYFEAMNLESSDSSENLKLTVYDFNVLNVPDTSDWKIVIE